MSRDRWIRTLVSADVLVRLCPPIILAQMTVQFGSRSLTLRNVHFQAIQFRKLIRAFYEIADADMKTLYNADTDADMDIENFQIADTEMNFSKNRGHGHDADTRVH